MWNVEIITSQAELPMHSWLLASFHSLNLASSPGSLITVYLLESVLGVGNIHVLCTLVDIVYGDQSWSYTPEIYSPHSPVKV